MLDLRTKRGRLYHTLKNRLTCWFVPMWRRQPTIDLKKEEKRLYEAIRNHLEPLFVSQGFEWHKGNFWNRDVGWCVQAFRGAP